jgi:hypothetical protein
MPQIINKIERYITRGDVGSSKSTGNKVSPPEIDRNRRSFDVDKNGFFNWNITKDLNK